MPQGLGYAAAGFLQGFGPAYAQSIRQQEAQLEAEQKRTDKQIQNIQGQLRLMDDQDPRRPGLEEEAIRLYGGTPLPPQMAKLSSLPLEQMQHLTDITPAAIKQTEGRVKVREAKDKKKAARALKIFDSLEKERQAWEDYNEGDKSSILQEFGKKPAWNKRKEKLWREAAELHFKIEGIDPRTISGEPPGPPPTITLEEFIRKQKEAGKTEEEAFMEAMKAEL